MDSFDNSSVKKPLLIDRDLAQAIADYLVQRPYREVAELIMGLMKLQPAEDSPADDKSTVRRIG